MPRFEVSTPPIGRWLDNSCRKRHFATYQTFTSAERKSRKMLIYLTGVVAVMIGCTYAAVPLYRRFCQATGYGGTIQRREVLFILFFFNFLFFKFLFFHISSSFVSDYLIICLVGFQTVEEKIARHGKEGTVTTRFLSFLFLGH